MSNPGIHEIYQLNWGGPFILQGSNGKSLMKSTAADRSGIYLFTVEYRDGYLVYAAGLTMRPFKKRFSEHIREYRKGTYTIFETKALRQGKRNEIWHGMWKKESTNTPEMKKKFLSLAKNWNQQLMRCFVLFGYS